MISDHVKKLPIFWGHGKDDPLVRYVWGEQSGSSYHDIECLVIQWISCNPTIIAEYLKTQLGIKIPDASELKPVGIDFHGYEGLPHSAGEQELEDLQEWLKKVVPKGNA